MRHEWTLPPDVTYLNHGSFGPSPLVVQQARQEWSARLESQPMDFFLRRMEDHLDAVYQELGAFVGTNPDDLVFTDNATAAMNIVAVNVALAPGDEVLLTDQEYGAVLRIWRNVCRDAGANLVVHKLPGAAASDEEMAAAFLEAVTEKTRLIVVSHVTSPTALRLPVEEICRRARELGVPVCIDGPHALAMVPLELKRLGCDFYAASCHKWLSGPFGTGFLYVTRARQQGLKPVVTSWGGSVSGRSAHWRDEFTWSGTRDPAGFLAIGSAIEFLEFVGLETFRRLTRALAEYARERITETTGIGGEVFDPADRFGSMVAMPLPTTGWEPPEKGKRDPLQNALWERYRIEAPIISWSGRRLIRVSCHLYNTTDDIDRLAAALGELLAE